MTKQFSSEELHHLRNDLPIETLIKALGITHKRCEGELFRFECPQCFGYHTAVQSKTNLARCFTCKQNFNPIDLTMFVKKIPFVTSVKLLKRCEHNLADIKPRCANEITCRRTTPLSVGELLKKIALATRKV